MNYLKLSIRFFCLILISFFLVNCSRTKSIFPPAHITTSYYTINSLYLEKITVLMRLVYIKKTAHMLGRAIYYHRVISRFPLLGNYDDDYMDAQYDRYIKSFHECLNVKSAINSSGQSLTNGDIIKPSSFGESAHYPFRFWLINMLLMIIVCLLIGLVILQKRKIVRLKQLIIESNAYKAKIIKENKDAKNKLLEYSERVDILLNLEQNHMRRLQSVLELALAHEGHKEKFYIHFKEYMKITSGNNLDLSNDIITIANMACNKIIDYLNHSNPALSQYESCYCSLICLGFTPESIRVLFNHSNAYSIYIMRYKIRNKLGITGRSISLESYLKNVRNELDR